MSSIFFYSIPGVPSIKEKRKIKVFLLSVFSNEKVLFKRLNYIFCTDEHLLTMNQEYLKHDDYTDILTFTLSEKNNTVSSEIYISIDRVKENAISLNVYYSEELLRVMIHGVLHLCGYEDDTPYKKLKMRKKENFYLSMYDHVPRGTKN